MRTSRASLPVLSLLLMLSVRPARAETGAAAALFETGRAAMKRGDFVVACSKFSESYRLEPAVGTELNLALCEEKLGRELSAWRRLQHVIDTLPSGDDRLPIAERHRDELDARLPRVTLVAPANFPAAANIRIGDSHLTVTGLGVSIPVERGVLEVAVEAPGHLPREYRLMLQPAARATLPIEVGPRSHSTAERKAAPAPRRAPRGSARPTFGFLSLGVGGALLATSAVTGLAAIKAKRDMDEQCDESYACSQRGLDAAERGKDFALASTLAFAAGAIGVGLGTWVLLSQSGSRETERGSQVSLYLGGPGLGVEGSFQ